MMKKYLMMGIAALALASCSKDEVTYVNPDVQKYETAFINRFGQPNPNQTWGFSANASRALTRGTYPNANMWAEAWVVVPQLTPEQKDIVRQYFQQNQLKKYEDPGWTNYFVQQVYKGGTNTTGSESPEQYESANSVSWNPQYVIGSNHMDHLAAVYPNNTQDHIFNFNYGTCSTNPNVQNTDTVTYLEPKNATEHSDEIQLMVNSTTNKFGYFNSDGSLGHTEYTSLVSWKTIRTWANGKGLNGELLNDGWNRSFMGFDFEQIVGDDIYVHTDTDSLNAEGKTFLNGKGEVQKTLRYATYRDMPDWTYVWDGTKAGKFEDVVNRDGLIIFDGKPVPMLIAQTNEYCGDNGDVDWNQHAVRKLVKVGTRYNNNTGEDEDVMQEELCLDLTYLYEMLDNEYLPVISSTMGKWVKVHGGADGYYSDWIVTLTEAKPVNDTPIIPDEPDDDPYDLRIMAEDLTVSENSDFDFNDIVFDVKWISSEQVDIKILAAGGIYPIRINERSDWEAHAILGASMTMTNTYPGAHYAKTASQILHVSGNFGSSKSDQAFFDGVKAIKVEVSKNGGQTWTPLEAPTGKVASKIAVPVTVEWCDEFQDIDVRWGGSKSSGKFAAWVQNPSQKFWE
jgi:hypothetical protein